MIRDWFLIAAVIVLTVFTFIVIASFVDELIEYWREYRDAGTPR